MKKLVIFGILCSWAGYLSALETIYRLEGHPDQYFLETQEIPSLSTVTCGFLCRARNCGSFSFQDGICKVHDAGASSPPTNGRARMYYLFDPSVPPENLTDVAFGKPTLPDVHYAHLVSSRAVDGDLGTQYYSLIDSIWWSVDLEGTYIIRNIDVLPHGGGVANWFRVMKVFVGSVEVTDGDFSLYTEVADYPGTWDGSARIVFTPPTLTAGRYVAIQGYSGQSLNIVDVKVMV